MWQIYWTTLKIIISLEEGGAFHLNKLEFPSPKDACVKFGWNWPSGSLEEDENANSLRTENDQKSSLELSAQVRK